MYGSTKYSWKHKVSLFSATLSIGIATIPILLLEENISNFYLYLATIFAVVSLLFRLRTKWKRSIDVLFSVSAAVIAVLLWLIKMF